VSALPDPALSRAVLIGVSGYVHLEPLPAVANNLPALAEVLTGGGSWNLPPDHCTVVAEPDSTPAMLDAVQQAAEVAEDTLLVYFAGHGLLDGRGELFFGLPHSVAGRSHTGVTYQALREILTDASAQRFVITLDTDGPAGTKTGTITATDGHPFWVPQLHQWVNAGDLKTGQWLQTSSGTWIQITVIRHHTQQTSVYNLTIDGLHTYYVGYGQAVLVHNAEPGCGPHLALGLRNIRGGQQGLLDEFARGLGAIAYQDPMFKVPIGGVMTEPMVKDMIDLVVSRGGRMTFNMHGITKVDEMLAGGDSYVATRVTAMELRYICGSEAARAITTFANGAAPC